MSLRIGLIEHPMTWEHWAAAKAMLTPALDASDEDWPEVEGQLTDGRAHLGAVIGEGGDLQAAMVLRSIDGKDGPVCEMFLIGGANMRSWVRALSDQLAKGAKKAGYKSLRAYGRRGWEPVLKACGWKAPVVCFEMAV